MEFQDYLENDFGEIHNDYNWNVDREIISSQNYYSQHELTIPNVIYQEPDPLPDHSGQARHHQSIETSHSTKHVKNVANGTEEPSKTLYWLDDIAGSLASLRNYHAGTTVTQDHFTVDNHLRYEAKKSLVSHLPIFPWFRRGGRFRQTLNDPNLPSIDSVIEGMNFILKKSGSFNEEEMHFFGTFYQNLDGPPQRCLSTVYDLYEAYKQHFGCREKTTSNVAEIVRQHTAQISDLDDRISGLERLTMSDINPGSKRPRQGGDRACYFPIRSCDFESRAKWCIPGGVFGLYSDGVGRLLPLGMGSRQSIVVYSTDPDTLEPHPEPDNPDHYVPIVMIGEAPVILREDQITKISSWRGHHVCNIYVNKHGDVCLRQFQRGTPPGGTIFAMAEWSNVKLENGLPIFQGVRGGICAKIFSSQITTPQKRSSAMNIFFKGSFSYVACSDRNLSIEELDLKRKQKYSELAAVRQRQRDECVGSEKRILTNDEHESDTSDDEEEIDHTAAPVPVVALPLNSMPTMPTPPPVNMKSPQFKLERQKIKKEIKHLESIIHWKIQHGASSYH